MTLHFIWFQGLDHAPAALRPIPGKWAELNPGCTVKVWDGEMIRTMVSMFYPELLDFYEAIGEDEADNIRVIKKCDFARLLILHHHGGMYLDMDCDPLRPLDSLFLDGTVRHRLSPFRYARHGYPPSVLPENEDPVPVDFNRYELILSREHEPNEDLGGYNAANTVIIARAGSPLLLEMIMGCLGRERMKVLEFAGPLGLSKWLTARAGRLKGRVLMLPPYYFLWQAHDMGPPWRGTVCLHMNRLVWTDRTKAVPWDI